MKPVSTPPGPGPLLVGSGGGPVLAMRPPELVRGAIEPQVITRADEFARKENALFLGRGLQVPTTLVTAEPPVGTIAPNDALREKLKSKPQEVRARGGERFVFADADTRTEAGSGLHVVRMPEHHGALSPILHVVPLQLLAHHTACARGTDVDQPRNPARSVTVE